MAHNRKGITVTAGCWGQHLRPYGRGLFWSKQRQDDKRLAMELDDGCSAPKRKKRVGKRPYAIERRTDPLRSNGWQFFWTKVWKTCGSYRTAVQRDEALAALRKGENHGLGRPLWEYRAVDYLPKERT